MKKFYEVRHQFDGNANIEGAAFDNIDEAREDFEAECSMSDSRSKTVWIVETEVVVEDGEIVDVIDLDTIDERTIIGTLAQSMSDER